MHVSSATFPQLGWMQDEYYFSEDFPRILILLAMNALTAASVFSIQLLLTLKELAELLQKYCKEKA